MNTIIFYMKFLNYNGDFMSLIIDTKKIEDEVKILDENIKKYLEINNDIFFELSKLGNYLKENDEYLNNKILKDKNQSLLINNNLNDISIFYKKLEHNYSKYDEDGE